MRLYLCATCWVRFRCGQSRIMTECVQMKRVSLNSSVKSPWRQYTNSGKYIELDRNQGDQRAKKASDPWWWQRAKATEATVDSVDEWFGCLQNPVVTRKLKTKRLDYVHLVCMSQCVQYIYWCVAVLLLLHCVLAADFIANEWCH